MIRKFAYSLVPVLLLGAWGCDSGASESAPVITEVNYLEQSPQNPLSLRYEVIFTDSDGDLGSGQLLLLVNDKQVANESLDKVFAAQFPVLSSTVTASSFRINVLLSQEVESGGRFDVGFVLFDGQQQSSNTFTVVMQSIGSRGN